MATVSIRLDPEGIARLDRLALRFGCRSEAVRVARRRLDDPRSA